MTQFRFNWICSAIALCGISASGASAQLAVHVLRQPELVPAAQDEGFARLDAEAPLSDVDAVELPVYLVDSSGAIADAAHDEGQGHDAHESGHDSHGDHAHHASHNHQDHAYHVDDAWSLKNYIDPCCQYVYGGWLQAGYHSDNTGFSHDFNDLHDFNDVPDQLNLHQAWLFFGKEAESHGCSADWGYRADVVYGTDAQRFQAFGNDDAEFEPGFGNWDNSLDHGEYGWAIPQAYGEVTFGSWSVKFGHFLANVGYEKVPSIYNFFYSHSLTFESSVPFTYTGVAGEYHATEHTSYLLGWALGWDTGFDQFDGGNMFLGGVHHQLVDDLYFVYSLTAGNLGFRSAGEPGYSHSIELIADLCHRLQYVMQSNYVYTEGAFDHADEYGEEVGIVQYLFYTLNEQWKLGSRVEWLKTNHHDDEHISFYELTGGLNYRPQANLVIRPEIRYDWSPSEVDDYHNREVFGIDAILTF